VRYNDAAMVKVVEEEKNLVIWPCVGEILHLLLGGNMMHELPVGTATLLFTDMEGSTRLFRLLGKRFANVLTECRDLLREAFHQHHGHEVDTQRDELVVPLFHTILFVLKDFIAF
jgi:class 3 adenylate cyclase